MSQMHAAKEGIWLRSFIKEIQGGEGKPLTISCDNQGAIAGKGQQIQCKDEAHQPTISFHP